MKRSIILLAFFIIFCKSNDFNCGFWDDQMESIEFYSTSFEGSVPKHCNTSFSPMNLTESDKFKVRKFKIRGYKTSETNEFIQNYPNLHSMDISYSKNDNDWMINRLNHKNLAILNISHSEFYDDDVEHYLPNLTELYLLYNNIENLFSDIMYKFIESKKLLKLDLSHNKIYRLEFPIDIENFYPIESLDLSYNLIEMIVYDEFLSYIPKLKSLHLENNPIRKFDCKILWRVKQGLSVYMPWNNIEHFNCNSENINAIPNSDIEGVLTASNGTIKLHCNNQSFSKIKTYEVNSENSFAIEMMKCLTSSLKTLYLSGNFSGKLNDNTLEQFVDLEELELRETKLSNFDFSWLHNQKHLQRLYVSKDSIKTMSNVSYLERFEQLENVTIMENQLQDTPEVFHYMKSSVKYIKISGNFIGVLYCRDLERFENLISLSLNNVDLSLSECFIIQNRHKNLQFLDISYNNLENEIPARFSLYNLNYLNTLNVAYCKIKNGIWLLKHISSTMKHFRLSGNHLGSVEVYADTAKSFDKLEYLHFDDMNASNFDIGMLVRSHSLKFLNVSYNNMKTMDLTISYGNKTTNFSQLEELYLEENDLVDPEHLNPTRFPNLRKLAIAKNRFSCEYLSNLMQTIWPRGTKLLMAGEYYQQKDKNCTFINVQNTTPTTNLESELKWLYITIGIFVLIIIIIIISSVCFVFRKRIFKRKTPNNSEDPTVLWNGNEGIEISSLPNDADAVLAERISSADHIYESIPYLRYAPYNHLDYNQRKPIPTKDHYSNHLILKQRRQNSI